MCKSGMTNRNLEWQQEPEREKSGPGQRCGNHCMQEWKMELRGM